MRPVHLAATVTMLLLATCCQVSQEPDQEQGREPRSTPTGPTIDASRQETPAMMQVTVNGVALTDDAIAQCQMSGVRLAPGSFWYDPLCGAWGFSGGPCAGFVQAGLTVGGPLAASASGGGSGLLTGVFINGRELHPTDVHGLQQLGPVYLGRYWVDAQGNFGFEGQPAAGNLVVAAQMRWKQSGGAYQKQTQGGYIGGDGDTSYFFDPQSGASVIPGQGVSY